MSSLKILLSKIAAEHLPRANLRISSGNIKRTHRRKRYFQMCFCGVNKPDCSIKFGKQKGGQRKLWGSLIKSLMAARCQRSVEHSMEISHRNRPYWFENWTDNVHKLSHEVSYRIWTRVFQFELKSLMRTIRGGHYVRHYPYNVFRPKLLCCITWKGSPPKWGNSSISSYKVIFMWWRQLHTNGRGSLVLNLQQLAAVKSDIYYIFRNLIWIFERLN